MDKDEIPNEYLCPITLDIMKEPLIMPDGHTYEKEAIKKALEITHASPLTKIPMKIEDGVINYSLKSLIENYVNEHNIQLNDITEKINNLTFSAASTEAEEVEFEEIKSRIISEEQSSGLCKDSLHVWMKPKKLKTTSPACIICVVDISGSMGCNCCNNIENMETQYISRLELVKHSLKAIVSSLRKEDMFSIVTFSNDANIHLEPTLLIDKAAKETVISSINKMNLGGCTNIWRGIEEGINVSKSVTYKNYQKSLMVFTDGNSNINPPDGVYQTLKDTLKVCDDKFTISTFSFGNDVGPKLLIDIANLGNGIYGYCPDGTMVGTIFINYMASLLSTITPVIKVIVEQGDDIKKTMTIGPLYRATYRNAIFKIDKNLIDKTKVTVELPMTNQIIDVPIINESPDLKSFIDDMYEKEKQLKEAQKNEEEEEDDDDDEILDSDSDSEDDNAVSIDINNIDTDIIIEEKEIESTQYEERLLNQILRNKFIIALNKIIKIEGIASNEEENGKAKTILDEYIKILKELKYKTKFAKDLLIDITNPDPNHGQVEKAIQQDYYGKWGECYINSFLRFHQYEQCGNFKDQSLQYYTQEVADAYRLLAKRIFINLPPPSTKTSRRGVINTSTSTGSRVQMGNFMNRHGGCFNGDAIVLLANGQRKCVRDLKKGDILYNNAIVQCLIEQTLNKLSKPYMCDINGVLLTPYHPIAINNTWYFPNDLINAKEVSIDSWFNLILQDDINQKYEVEFDNGIKAITLGHHREENNILKHPYFGSDLVLKDLQERDPQGYSNGYILIKEFNFRQLKYDENEYCMNYYKISNDLDNASKNEHIFNNIEKLIC
ncbi:hypothetical protein BCR36DRAFT_585864 [Piromyces finnis]|uniref:VWFA domain-containing protein n=1 Tax=Piromyces finnis TaxID=1754191 RepID=A0A1Y1V169_9FUNG|nr:hypothetical protein BCR36DRAFT_585864 [Piromyces finnis]|eukprot:ORX44984.1 hypothetical protein BCR36DRAFT_585864 [Piromyces finnis]